MVKPDFKPRKVMKMGESSGVISLPKSWLEKTNLNAGDTVHIKETPSGELLLSPQFEKIRPLKVEIPASYKHLPRSILYNYVYGADEITIKTEKLISPRDLSIIKETVEKVSGLEITETNSKKVVLETCCGIIPIQKIIKRFSHTITNLFDAAMKAFEKGDAKDFETIKGLSHIERPYYLILRSIIMSSRSLKLSKKLNVTPEDMCCFITAAQNLMEIFKQFKKLRYVENVYNKEILEFLKRTNDYYLKSMNLFSPQPLEPIYDAMGDIETLLHDIYVVDKKVDLLKPEEQQPIEDILYILRVILSHIDSNFGIALLYNMRTS